MLKKFCEYCGSNVHPEDDSSAEQPKTASEKRKRLTSSGNEEAEVHTASTEDEDLAAFLAHFASLENGAEVAEDSAGEESSQPENSVTAMEDATEEKEDELAILANLKFSSEDEDSDEEEDDEEEETKEANAQDIETITERLDKVASLLEDQGHDKLAFQVDSIADSLDEFIGKRSV